MVPLPVSDKDSFDKKRDYIKETLDNMNNAIYGHVEAKNTYTASDRQMDKNPDSLGIVLAIKVLWEMVKQH